MVPYELYVAVAERLNALTPGAHAKKTAFFTTGAEAVENAVKIARCHTGRPAVISFFGGYHGRTSLTLAMTGKVRPYKVGVGPFPGEVYHAAYPDALHAASASPRRSAISASCSWRPWIRPASRRSSSSRSRARAGSTSRRSSS